MQCYNNNNNNSHNNKISSIFIINIRINDVERHKVNVAEAHSHVAESTLRDSVTAEVGPQSRNILFIDLYAMEIAHYPSKVRYKVDQINFNSQKNTKIPSN